MAVRENETRSVLAASKPEDRKEAQRLWTVALGDVLVFLIFAVIGRRSHGEAAGLTSALQVVWTALPFLLAWFVISPFVGAFRRELMTEPKKMARRVVLAWVASWPIALFLHFVFEREVPSASTVFSFGLVTLIVNSIFLLIWRVPFAMANRAKDKRAS